MELGLQRTLGHHSTGSTLIEICSLLSGQVMSSVKAKIFLLLFVLIYSVHKSHREKKNDIKAKIEAIIEGYF